MLKTNLLVSLILLLSCPSLAWWEEGHVVVAEIAWERLGKSERSEISDLLNHHPDPQVSTFAWASVWPDIIKQDDHPLHRFNRPVWHYQNRPICKDQSSQPDSGKLLEALGEQLAVYRDRSRSKRERSIALCWVVHLVGDIHQPLHNASYFSPEFELGDMGGNRSKVQLGNRELSLHKLWDSAGGRFLAPTSVNRLQSYSRYFAQKYGTEFSSAESLSLDFQAWSDEGYQICQEQIYPEFTNHMKLEEDDQNTARELTARQMTLAGFRLAELLMSDLSKSGQSSL